MTDLGNILKQIIKQGYIHHSNHNYASASIGGEFIPTLYNKISRHKLVNLDDTIMFSSDGKKHKGVVMYIHPQKRYFTVDTGKWRECVWFDSDFVASNGSESQKIK